ncbi:MAG: CapA family protein [Erysipelotrichaceae bacterium]|nr:CapA family protein [Erysipelotrichaceae bacterium]MDY5252024.1 CapA family protein [Erysipelotrichaceae bacterium]
MKKLYEGFIFKTIIGVVVTVLLLYISLNIFVSYNQQNNQGVTPKTIVPAQVERYNLDLFMVGDALLHGAVNYAADTGEGYDYSGMLDSIKPILGGYDLKYYNQETILGGDYLGISSYPRFNTPQAFGDYMIDELGFNMVGLANNHALDMNEEGILNSLAYWEDKDVYLAGAHASLEDQQTLEVHTMNNISFAFLSYTYGTNGLLPPAGKEYLVDVYDEKVLQADIQTAKSMADVVIVSMHWGIEYDHEPSAEQQELAKLMADSGADIIIGSHPHVIQPVAWVDDTIVYYSLGNLISAQDQLPSLIGMMGSVKITKSVIDGEVDIEISQPKADLLYTYYSSDYTQFKVYTFDELNDDILMDHQKVYEEYSSIITAMDDNIIVGNIK